MSESNLPFTEHVTRAQSVGFSSRLAWGVAAVVGALLLVFFGLWASLRASLPQWETLQAKLDQTAANLASAQAENQTNQDLINLLKSQLADLEQEKKMAAQMSKALEDELRADLESKDVTLSQLQGKLTVTILDRVMFDSGEAVLKPDGEAVMQKIAGILAKHTDLKIQVIGHTDNVPIRASAHTRFASNWELSAARALAAVHFLVEQAQVDPRRVGAVGYGEYRPIADNSTAEGRAQNRRIAITILPDELARADTLPAGGGKPPGASPASSAAPGP